MAAGIIEFRHIVDVDGQLIGIDAEVTDAATLLRRAGRSVDRRLVLVRIGERTALTAKDRIRLREDEVLFFESVPGSARLHSSMSSVVQLAA